MFLYKVWLYDGVLIKIICLGSSMTSNIVTFEIFLLSFHPSGMAHLSLSRFSSLIYRLLLTD